MIKPLSFLFGLAVLAGCAPSQQATDAAGDLIVSEDVRPRIDSALRTLVDEGRVAGVSALIFEKDREVYFNAFGHADKEANVAMDRNTIVRIYSMTKPVTGVALMQLYEKGAFQLDDPLEKYAPEFADLKVFKGAGASGKLALEPAKRPVTIRDLTRHTAGFINNNNVPGLEKLLADARPMSPENTLSQMAARLGKLPLMFHPGEQWSYGVSVDVQAFLVERLSGKPFDQYLKENVFDPLGMSTTRYVVPESDMKKFAAMYRKGDDGLLTRIPDEDANAFNVEEWPLKPGGYGLTSTLDDYMRFARMLVNEGKLGDVAVLREETVKLMSTNHLADSIQERMWLPSKGQVGFGIDFAVRLRPPANEQENIGVVGEFFWDGAASTLFWVDPVNELTAVLFVQVMPFDREVHRRFREAVYGVQKASASID
jgi:CubicO group peptidase (beta-lactamase class C family)